MIYTVFVYIEKTMNASCTSTNECDSNLICSSGHCQCPSDKYFWDNIACMKSKFVKNYPQRTLYGYTRFVLITYVLV